MTLILVSLLHSSISRTGRSLVYFLWFPRDQSQSHWSPLEFEQDFSSGSNKISLRVQTLVAKTFLDRIRRIFLQSGWYRGIFLRCARAQMLLVVLNSTVAGQ